MPLRSRPATPSRPRFQTPRDGVLGRVPKSRPESSALVPQGVFSDGAPKPSRIPPQRGGRADGLVGNGGDRRPLPPGSDGRGAYGPRLVNTGQAEQRIGKRPRGGPLGPVESQAVARVLVGPATARIGTATAQGGGIPAPLLGDLPLSKPRGRTQAGEEEGASEHH
jgi:hypothetical protein